jgi:hypothetical protein
MTTSGADVLNDLIAEHRAKPALERDATTVCEPHQFRAQICISNEDGTLSLLPNLSASLLSYTFTYDPLTSDEYDEEDYDDTDDEEDLDPRFNLSDEDEEDEEPLPTHEDLDCPHCGGDHSAAEEAQGPWQSQGILNLDFTLTPQTAFDLPALLTQEFTVILHYVDGRGYPLVSNLFACTDALRSPQGHTKITSDFKPALLSITAVVPYAQVMFPSGLLPIPEITNKTAEGH